MIRDRLTRNAPSEAFSRPQSFSTFPFSLRAATTGTLVTVDTAVELIPVYSAVNLISSAIGSLPCKVYTNADPRTEARGSRQWRMLHDTPNDEIAADEFWQWVTACLLLWGNAFVWKERDDNGVVTQLWPIRPSRVLVGREDAPGGGTRRYFILDNRPGRVYDVDILHIRGLTTDGLVGYSPVQLARQQLANDTAAQEFQGSFLKNGLFSNLVFTHPNTLTKDAQTRLREQMSDRAGWLRAGEVPILEEGADLKNLTMSLVDSEFVSLAKMSEHRIAQLFGLVPPHTWGATDQGKTMTYQNSEFGGLEFVKWTLRPWLVRLEQSVGRDPGIFPKPGPTLFAEFLVEALLRADTQNRYQTYQIGIDAGIINPEWVRAVENITLPEGTTAAPTPKALPAGPAATDTKPLELVKGRSQELVTGDARANAGLLDELRSLVRPEVRVDAPVTVLPPTQLPPDVIVNNPDHSQALRAQADSVLSFAESVDRLAAVIAAKEMSITVPETVVNVDVPDVTVNVPAPVVNVNVAEDDQPEQLQIDFVRNANGTIKSATVTEN